MLVYLNKYEAFVMIMSFFCKESTAHFGIESGYDLLNLISICVYEKPFKIEWGIYGSNGW